LNDADKKVWSAILDDAFQRFLSVIDENRENLDRDSVKKLATGQVYTAEQALKNGLVDEIGYLDDAVAHLQNRLGLSAARVVTYESPPTLFDLLTEASESRNPQAQWRTLVEAAVPRAMYLCSWLPVLPAR